MINLRILLGLIPNTEKLEAKENALWAEFEDYKTYTGSDELKRYQELNQYINSPEFPRKVAEIKARKFADTEECRKEKEFLQMAKDPRFKVFMKVKSSSELAVMEAFEKSPEYNRLEELDKLVTSSEFLEKRNSTNPKEFKQAPEYESWNEYLKLKKSPDTKKYFKFKASQKYRTYAQIEQSDMPAKYAELEQYVHSEEFRKVKEYMLLSPKKKFEVSEEYKLQQEYLTLSKSEKITWYLRATQQDKFHELKTLTLRFEDDFISKKLDASKWITRYFWGDKILKDAYSLATDQHFLTDGENIEITNSTLKINTRQEEVTGKAWDPLLGFFPKDFKYTSGIISSGKSFRQQFGVIQAKIRLNKPGKVTHAFWMTGDRILPQIDIFKSDNSKLLMTNFWGNITEKEGIRKNTVSLTAPRLMNGFFIFALEWSPDKLVWKVNGVKMAEMTGNIPQEPLYINFSSGIYKDKINGNLPAAMEVDWVKVYEKAAEKE